MNYRREGQIGGCLSSDCTGCRAAQRYLLNLNHRVIVELCDQNANLDLNHSFGIGHDRVSKQRCECRRRLDRYQEIGSHVELSSWLALPDFCSIAGACVASKKTWLRNERVHINFDTLWRPGCCSVAHHFERLPKYSAIETFKAPPFMQRLISTRSEKWPCRGREVSDEETLLAKHS